MVKEVPQPSKYQCEGCDKVYTNLRNAQKCEAKGLPEFKYSIGDEAETIIQLIRISETRINVNIPQRLFDTGGKFEKVKITDRYYWNHKPFYTIEHPQIQGQYWRYPELAFELPDELNELREPVPDKLFEIETDIFTMQFNERALRFEAIWKGFRDCLRERGIAHTYSPEIIAEPINPT